MQHPSLARFAASLAGSVATLALTATIAAAQGSTPPKPTTPAPTAPTLAKTAAGSIAPPACTVKFAVDSIPSAATPLIVNAALSAAIGDSISASFPSASGISAVSVGPSATGGANALQLTLNTSAAKAGEWPVALKGKTGECSGSIRVVAGK